MKTMQVLLMGGGGNQLFQLARAWSLKNQGINCCVLHFGKATSFAYKIAGLTLHRDWLDTAVLAKSMGISARTCNFMEALWISFGFLRRKYLRSSSENIFDLELTEVVTLYRDGKELPVDVGYFQSRRHLAPGAVEAVAAALIRHENIDINPQAEQELIVHLRGGDFESHERHGERAIKVINEIARTRSLRIKVITNDRDFFAKMHTSGLNGSLSSTTNARDDFCLLAGSKNLVLSNSTFSFWAAACSASLQQPNIYVAPEFAQKELLKTECNFI